MPLPAVEQLLAIETVADRLKIAPKTIRNWIGARRIAVHRIGRAVRIPESEIQRILDEGYGPAVREESGSLRPTSPRRPRRNYATRTQAPSDSE